MLVLLSVPKPHSSLHIVFSGPHKINELIKNTKSLHSACVDHLPNWYLFSFVARFWILWHQHSYSPYKNTLSRNGIFRNIYFGKPFQKYTFMIILFWLFINTYEWIAWIFQNYAFTYAMILVWGGRGKCGSYIP